MNRSQTAFLGVLAIAVLAGCGSEATPSSAGIRAPSAGAGDSPMPTGAGSPLPPATVAGGTSGPTPIPSSTTSNPDADGWYVDSAPGQDTDDGTWVAAWFTPDDGLTATMVRYWTLVPFPGEPTPGDLLAASVQLLDTTPPAGMASAFTAALEVRTVTTAGQQVDLDLAADSPGLAGHGSYGLIVGQAQLLAAASFYFPAAGSLCIAYDGRPTDTAAGGPSFLHDADGCPLSLPPSGG